MELHGYRFKKLGEAEYEMEKNYEGAPIRFFAEERLLRAIEEIVFIQARNVAQLPGLVGHVSIMPDTHSGYGAPIGTVFAMDAKQGYVSPGAIGYDINCGMRLIATNLFFDEVQPHVEKLVNLLFEHVPPGVGKRGFLRVGKNELKKLVEEGVSYLVHSKGIGWTDDIDHIEEKGNIQGANIAHVSEKAQERGMYQFATLGSGNHYLEIQKVAEIFDEKIAKEWGMEGKGQIMVMVHCGSRGFGHQVCTDYLREFERHSSELKQRITDRQLVCLSIDSSSSRRYLSAMATAANFAFVNREAITHQIRRVFERVFGKTAEEIGMKLVYDVAHNNIGKFEEHGEKVLVHRKGATRSFPHQPVIIGGSMETGSYLLVGQKESLQKSFGSTAHGSGRTMSRAKAKTIVQGGKLWQEMKQRGIYVKSDSLSGLAEEAGLAYKNIANVIQSIQSADLSKPVAYLRPIGNIKG